MKKKRDLIRILPGFCSLSKILRPMKLTTLFLVVTGFQVISAMTYSQSTELSLDLGKTTVEQVLKEIENLSEYYFLFNQKLVNVSREVNVNVSNQKIDKILANVFEGTDVDFVVMDRQIILSPRKYLKNIKSEQPASTITGTVTDASTGEPLPGVYVIVEGTTQGAITNVDGSYSLEVSGEDAVLRISCVGYETQEIPVGSRSVIDVQMVTEITELTTVVVTGYSSEQKKDIIGSVAVVNTEDMMQTNTATVGGQLQGRASGVFVTSNGDPDANAKVRIRGFGSFGGSTPLYIIDGVPADENAFNSLNPNDVESIQVLKDASSASIYGARAASGVVIISTKQGQSGRTKVSLDVYSGINYVSSKDFPELLNAEEYGEYWWKSYEGAGITPNHAQYGLGAEPSIPEYLKAGTWTGDQLENLKTSDPALFAQVTDPSLYDFETYQIVKSADTDWFDKVFNPAQITSVQLGATGGSENGTYALSLRYYDQDNTSNEWADFKRYTVRSNSSFNITDNVRIGENLQVAYTHQKGSGSGSPSRLMNPLLPVYDIMGMPASGAVAGMGNARNPIGDRWRSRFDKSNSTRIFGNVYGEVTLFNDLVARTTLGVSYSNSSSWNLSQQTYEHAENTSISSLAQSSRLSSSWTWTNTLVYTKTFGNHSLNIVAGTEAIQDYTESVTGNRQDYDINDDPNFVMLNTGLGLQTNSGDFSRESLASLFGKLDYSYADKYLLNATLRRDGSSKFGENNRYGIFPAVGIGWRISQENFMQGLSWLDDLKLRGSYGVIGNQTGLGAQNQYTRYTKNLGDGYAINGGNTLLPGFVIDAIGNPDARWEKSITTNAGFDMTMYRGRLSLSFEYYIKETEDLLVENQAPETGSSASQPDVNIGNMTNKGIDANVTARGNILSDLSYEVTATFSHYKNTVDKVLDSEDSFLSGASDQDMGVITRTEKGNPISYLWGYEVDGFFNTQAEADAYAAEYSSWITPEVGRWRIKDQNGDKIIDEEDRVQIGSPHPDFQVGFNVSLAYKNFDLSSFIFWNQGGQIFSTYRRDQDMNLWQYNRSKRMLYDSWTPDNTDALLPKLDINDTESKSFPTDYYVEDITYVRLKTLQLGYTLPQSLTSRLNIERMRIYVQGQNLLTILGGDKPFTGLDPDASLSGTDISMGVVSSQNPTPRQFVVGLNLEF